MTYQVMLVSSGNTVDLSYHFTTILTKFISLSCLMENKNNLVLQNPQFSEHINRNQNILIELLCCYFTGCCYNCCCSVAMPICLASKTLQPSALTSKHECYANWNIAVYRVFVLLTQTLSEHDAFIRNMFCITSTKRK
jgi:hypothetical protein